MLSRTVKKLAFLDLPSVGLQESSDSLLLLLVELLGIREHAIKLWFIFFLFPLAFLLYCLSIFFFIYVSFLFLLPLSLFISKPSSLGSSIVLENLMPSFEIVAMPRQTIDFGSHLCL